MEKYLLNILACPNCHGQLDYNKMKHSLICHVDKLRFQIDSDIPNLRLDQAEAMVGEDEDAL
jgi:uncharacterized protein